VFDLTPGAITSESWTGKSGQFRYTQQQCWALPCEHTSAGLCIGAVGAAGAAAADARDTTTTAPEAELQATHRRLQYRTADVVRRRWRTRACGVTGYTVAAPVEDWRRRAEAPVEDRSLRTSREPAAGVMDRRRSGQSSDSESRSLHSWTASGTTCRAAPLACSDWSEGRVVGRSRLDRVEGGRDDGKPGRTGRHLRCAVTGVLICTVGALVLTPRGLISHWFTLSLYMGLSRDQRYQSPIQLHDG
jgi:hypothetical protein